MKMFNNAVAALLAFAFVYLAYLPKEPPKDDWFKAVVVNESRPVMVKFGADWCPPCQHMEQVLDDLSSTVSGQVKIVRISVDEKPELAAHYGVRSIPRIFLFKNGRIVAKHGGFQDAKATKTWLDQQL